MESKCLCKAESSSSDIISTLPQTVIENILCLLPTTKEAARTSILSREWRYKWTEIPKLDFYLSHLSKRKTEENQVEGKETDMTRKPLHDLFQIMLLHKGPIHEFTLETDLAYDYLGLDQIILHLSKNYAVKKLTLSGSDESYWDKLPMSVFSLHHLTDLDLSCFEIDHQPISNGFGNLTKLSLRCIEISYKSLVHLVSNCPSLKSLTLLMCPSRLSDSDCTIIKLFECLPRIEHLTMSGLDPEWLVLGLGPQELPALLFHLKDFYFEEMCFADGHGLAFLLALIKCSPNLQKIKLDVHWLHKCYEQYSVVWEEHSDVLLEHLNELEIDFFGNSKPEMEFVKFILARSPKLKKVSLRCRVSVEERTEMLEVLLRTPRASPVLIYV